MDVDGVLRQRGSGPLVGLDTYVSSEFCWQEPSSSSPAGRNLPPMVLWLPGARGARPSHARKLQTHSQGVRAVARRLNPGSQGKVLSKLKMAPLVRSAGKWSFWYRRALTCSWIAKGSSAVMRFLTLQGSETYKRQTCMYVYVHKGVCTHGAQACSRYCVTGP